MLVSRSVSWEMMKFAVAYTSFLIGFMVMFMILFSEQEVFNSNFLGVFGKVMEMKSILDDFYFLINISKGFGNDDWGI